MRDTKPKIPPILQIWSVVLRICIACGVFPRSAMERYSSEDNTSRIQVLISTKNKNNGSQNHGSLSAKTSIQLNIARHPEDFIGEGQQTEALTQRAQQ